MTRRRLIILGSTGSIGTQTLEVVEELNTLHAQGDWPVRFDVVGLAAGRRGDALACQARGAGAPAVAFADGGSLDVPAGTQVFLGESAAADLIRAVDCDVVVAAMVGFDGLPATLAAVELGHDVALANKETLVAAGAVVVAAARRTGARLLPVDSEHSGVWQCLEGVAEPDCRCPPRMQTPGVERVILTASGGPLRTWTRERIRAALPADVRTHPTWSMGPKVTADSASLMNKALEIIEAHWLFGIESARLSALIHPQSVVHAIVEFAGGSAVAQLAIPDMRVPIRHALTWPARAGAQRRPLGARDLSGLTFEEPDADRFPALGLAAQALVRAGTTGAILNAANEEAVRAFLSQPAERPIPFGTVTDVVAQALERVPSRDAASLDDVRRSDQEARDFVRREMERR